MSDIYTNEPMIDMFIFETSQLVQQLEEVVLSSEKSSSFTQDSINEIFRIMHTIKGSSAMMLFNNVSSLAHSLEDIFFFMREDKPNNIDYSVLSDLVLAGVDFIKAELEKIKSDNDVDGDASFLISNIKDFLNLLKQENDQSFTPIKEKDDNKHQYYISKDKKTISKYNYSYEAVIYFMDGCQMENLHAYTILHNLQDITNEVFHIPEDLMENDNSIEIIREKGFKIYLNSNYSYKEMYEFFMKTIYLKDLELAQLENDNEYRNHIKLDYKEINDSFAIELEPIIQNQKTQFTSTQQSIISVNVQKLDVLMDLVGEMVIAEAMVVQNPELKGLDLNNFYKAARQLNKITSEIQDIVMSIRMVPLSVTFQKMHRVVRDMSKKLDKNVNLEIIGGETEVDKNIIEHISDPLMHLVRNALDHGIESSEYRKSKGKSQNGTITIEAKNAGSDVLIIIYDDGKGLDKGKILQKAKENGLLYRPAGEMTDREIFNLVLLPGFSTKDSISEFSGRGVGMDVVTKNIETLGGSVSIDSIADKGTTITVKIPLTLAIIDGMIIKVGNSRYTIPTISIKESFRTKLEDIITDPDGNEMIMVRGSCYPVLRLHKFYKVQTNITNISEGIIIMIELEGNGICIFADELLGQQQVVVKALPEYIRRLKKVKGLSGCTLLGDGNISLILDVVELINFCS